MEQQQRICSKCNQVIEDASMVRKRPNGKYYHEDCRLLKVLSRPAAAIPLGPEQKLKLFQSTVDNNE